MATTVNELFQEWSERCSDIGIILVKTECTLCQELETTRIKHLSSVADLQASCEFSLIFAIRCAPWSALFCVDFSISSGIEIPDYFLSLEFAENARMSDKALIEEKGKKAWYLVKELIKEFR